ncbi:MAG: sulfotransferase [Planctomycetota bacterium]|nr:sulfotransferase [Planctomycetota bacterium]
MREPSARELAKRAFASFQAGRVLEAQQLTHQALTRNAKEADALTMMGIIAYAESRFDEAESWQRKALAVQRRQPGYYCNLARTLTARGRLDQALAAFEKGLKLDPGRAEALVGKADVLERRGRLDRARTILEPLVRSGEGTPKMMALFMRILQRCGRDDEAVELAEQALARGDVQGAHRRTILLQLGRSRDRLGDCDGAFETFVEGNAIDARPFDLRDIEERIDRLMEVFSPEAMERLPRSDNTSQLPVFIVSMPRAGSTLVEQIIHAHPRAHGAGELRLVTDLTQSMPDVIDTHSAYPDCMKELTAEAANRLAKRYLNQLAKHRSGVNRITDKGISNYFHLGLITLLLPKAHVIYVHRHPMDMCFSCFFENLSPIRHPYTTDLRNLGLFYREHVRLMDHWRRIRDVRMLEVSYESLIEDQESASRRIIDFLGLEWDDKCLRFHEAKRDVVTISYAQVSRPIYRSAVARYKRYEKHLQPLRDALGDALPPEDDER